MIKDLLSAAALCLVLGITVGQAQADGGQVREASPVFNEDGYPVGVFYPLECQEYAPDHSGQVVIICTDED